MIRIISKVKQIKKVFKDVSLLQTIFWNCRCKRLSVPFLLYPDVHFRIGADAKVIHNGGRLKIGCRWDISRFRQSELKICNSGRLEINGIFDIYTGCSIDICSGAVLSLGSGYMNNNVRIAAFHKIVIGDNVAISENVSIRDSDNHHLSGSSKKEGGAPIVIGNKVWIGINVTILKGVTIGDGAVVAANSLVTRDVPPNTLVGGVPAKTIRENITWM